MTLLSASGLSHGMGFGHANTNTILGDTLRVTVPLRLEPGEDITDACLAAEVYFGEQKVSPKVISAEVMPGMGSERTVRISSTIAVNEPVVTIYLAAGCPALITRKIVAFPDPPSRNVPFVTTLAPLGEQAVSDAQAVQTPPSTAAAGAQPHPSRVAHTGGRTRPAAPVAAGALERAPGAAMSSLRLTDVAEPAARRTHRATAAGGQHKARARTPAPAPTPSVARLELDPVDMEAVTVPNLRMSPTLGAPVSEDDGSPAVQARRATAAAMWLALNATPEQMAKDQERLHRLEQQLNGLRQDGGQAKQQLMQMQQRLQEAEASNSGKWAVLLGLLALAGVGSSIYLFGRLRRAGGAQDAWWQSQASVTGAEPNLEHDSELGQTSVEFVHVPSEPGDLHAPAQPEPAPTLAPTPAPAARAMGRMASLHQAVPDAPAARPPMRPRPESSEPLREVSVEELIDLEQQAEFFVVLGQDDAAIDLLESHVQHTTAASPLPFLKLMEIYRRVGNRADYERVQAAFNQRFNAYAPAWEADLQQGHSLADYPGVIERLQSLWAAPSEAMAVLEKSLTRPESSDETFELPAYRELLFLYAVARDLAERESADRHSVDLLLPVIDMDSSEPMAPVQPLSIIEPLMATRPIKPQPEAEPSISLDLQLDDLQLDDQPVDDQPADRAPETQTDHKP